ncbi:unnamed protein product [Candidula unifasciata]|uniref:Alpha/beta hydrolase fold-3 domain-containing protein n=1 Tax=Candidula unifasciata TaxID=100452 RepID=A0A8S3YMA9_9EUPU|nr:unnamed protein product [Candidula unifasciata]
MVLKGLVLLLCVTVVGLAIVGYHPLPEGIGEPHKVQFIVGVSKIFRAFSRLKAYLGYGDRQSNILLLRDSPKTTVPESAAYGALKVTRAEIAGVPVIVYQPKDESTLHPAIVFFHGGGWVLGSPDTYDKTVYLYAVQTRTVVVSVGYRLAPEHPFPAPIQDCLDVTRFVLKHGSEYNIDVSKVGVVGDSAGGNLAAAVALKLTTEKSDLPPLRFQVLHYPALQAFDMRLPSYVDLNESVPILTSNLMGVFYAFYMGLDPQNLTYYSTVINENRHIPPHVRKSAFGEFVNVKHLPAQYQTAHETIPDLSAQYDQHVYEQIKHIITDPLFSPLMALDLAGVPPAFVHVCEFDVLRDDGFLYARRLQNAGVKVHLHFGKGGYHGDISSRMWIVDLHPKSGQVALAGAYAFIDSVLKQ